MMFMKPSTKREIIVPRSEVQVFGCGQNCYKVKIYLILEIISPSFLAKKREI